MDYLLGFIAKLKGLRHMIRFHGKLVCNIGFTVEIDSNKKDNVPSQSSDSSDD